MADVHAALQASLAQHAERVRGEFLKVEGFRWPKPLLAPGAADDSLTSAQASRERLAEHVERAGAIARKDVAAAEDAEHVAVNTRVLADGLKSTRERQLAEAVTTGSPPADLITADAVDVANARAENFRQAADDSRSSAIASDRALFEARKQLAGAAEDVGLAEVLIVASELIAPLASLRESLQANLGRTARTMVVWDQIEAAFVAAAADALGRKLRPLTG